VTLSGPQATVYAGVRLRQSSRQSRRRSLLVVPAASGLPSRLSSEPAGTSGQWRVATWHRRNTPFPYLVIVFQSASVRSLADEYGIGSTRRSMTCPSTWRLSDSRPTVCPVLLHGRSNLIYFCPSLSGVHAPLSV
jgi:hypothetical protein